MNNRNGKVLSAVMKYFVLYGLMLSVAVSAGCSRHGLSTRSTEPPVPPKNANVETVKQPLYKKSDFTAQKTKPETNPVEFRLNMARAYLDEKQYEKIPPILEEINQLEPANKKAADLANETFYNLGLAFYNNRQYIASRNALNRVVPEYKDTKLLLASVGLIIDQQADAHYKQGVKHFINEQLTSAISEWEKVLELDPGHLKAAEDIENARQLLNKIKNINQKAK